MCTCMEFRNHERREQAISWPRHERCLLCRIFILREITGVSVHWWLAYYVRLELAACTMSSEPKDSSRRCSRCLWCKLVSLYSRWDVHFRDQPCVLLETTQKAWERKCQGALSHDAHASRGLLGSTGHVYKKRCNGAGCVCQISITTSTYEDKSLPKHC